MVTRAAGDDRMKKEIEFYKTLTQLPDTFGLFPEYFGHEAKRSDSGMTSYSLYLSAVSATLGSEIQTRPCDFAATKRHFYRLVAALAFLQTHNYIHGNVRPESVYFRPAADGGKDAQLGDLGEARKVKPGAKEKPLKMGKYSALECQNSQVEDLFKAEAFSLGLVTLEMGGVSLDWVRPDKIDGFSQKLKQKFRVFEAKFSREIDSSAENKGFLQDLKGLLKVSPQKRSDCLSVFRKALDLQTPERLKYHIAVQDLPSQEVYSVSSLQGLQSLASRVWEYVAFKEGSVSAEGFSGELERQKKTVERYARLGSPRALLIRGLQLFYGLGEMKSWERAKTLLEKSCRVREDGYGRYLLALIEEDDDSKCVALLQKAASLENPAALNMLGVLHFQGARGCGQNYVEAASYFRKAANQDAAPAGRNYFP